MEAKTYLDRYFPKRWGFMYRTATSSLLLLLFYFIFSILLKIIKIFYEKKYTLKIASHQIWVPMTEKRPQMVLRTARHFWIFLNLGLNTPRSCHRCFHSSSTLFFFFLNKISLGFEISKRAFVLYFAI